MNNQGLEKISIRMQRLEDKYPDSFTTNKTWKQLYALREELSIRLMELELEHQREKLKRLNGRDTESAETLIRQYEDYLKKHKKGG